MFSCGTKTDTSYSCANNTEHLIRIEIQYRLNVNSVLCAKGRRLINLERLRSKPIGLLDYLREKNNTIRHFVNISAFCSNRQVEF